MNTLELFLICSSLTALSHAQRSFRFDEKITFKELVETFNMPRSEKAESRKAMDNVQKDGQTMVNAQKNGQTVERIQKNGQTVDKIQKNGQTLVNVQKSGQGKNCGPAGTHLNLTWTPETVISGEDITVYLGMVAVASLTEGTADIQIFLGKSAEGQPMFQFSDSRKCKDMQKIYKDFKCPIDKGDKVQLKYGQKIEQIPNGVYTAKINVNNEKGEQFACVEMTVQLKSPDN